MGGARVPRNQAERLVRETGPIFIVQKAFYTFDKTWRSMDNTKLCSVHNPDPSWNPMIKVIQNSTECTDAQQVK